MIYCTINKVTKKMNNRCYVDYSIRMGGGHLKIRFFYIWGSEPKNLVCRCRCRIRTWQIKSAAALEIKKAKWPSKWENDEIPKSWQHIAGSKYRMISKKSFHYWGLKTQNDLSVQVANKFIPSFVNNKSLKTCFCT